MKRFLPALLVLFFVALVGFLPAGERVALVVGNDQYEHLPAEAQLRVAAADAALIGKTLSSLNPPFAVTVLTNVSQDDAEEALDAFVDQAEGAECALVYYAGHGIEFHGENYLLAKDTDISKISADVPRMKRRLANEALSLQAWVDSLDATGAQVKVVILDACRDNPLEAETVSGTRSVVGGKGGLAQVTPPSGSLISYSADAGQQANDGLFTKILTDMMKIPNLSMLEMFAATREEVLNISTDMAAEDRGVRHEPAEYTKLNRAGTRFSFMTGGRTSGEELVKNMNKLKEAMAKEPENSVPAAGKPVYVPALSKLMMGKSAGEIRDIQDVELVWCPPTGTEGFMMGSPPEETHRGEDETRHRVVHTLGFWIGKTEVTQAEWTEVMGGNPSTVKGDDLPVESVNYEDVQSFLKKMNETKTLPMGWRWDLPTEAQWEYACRGGSPAKYSLEGVGEDLPITMANFNTNANAGDSRPVALGGAVEPVGSYSGNHWGIQDMHGNVWEICRDLNDGRDYFPGNATDPLGPRSGSYRVIRGGSFYNAASEARSANRDRVDPETRMSNLGFRLVMVYKLFSLKDLISE